MGAAPLPKTVTYTGDVGLRARFALLAAALVCGCGGGVKDKVVGTWKIDESSVHVEQKPHSGPGWNITVPGPPTWRITFNSNGTMSDGSRAGKWTLEGNQIGLVPDKPDPIPAPILILSDDGTRIHMVSKSDVAGTLTMDLVKAK